MVTEIILPQLGDTMDEATITRWFKNEGDAVKKGEPLFELLTDKANIEVEATTTGFLRSVLFGENVTVPTGKVIAYVTTTVDEKFAPSATTVPLEKERQGELSTKVKQNGATAPTAAPIPEAFAPRRKTFVSPRARRVAQEFGVDVSQLSPTSKTGRIMEADVRRVIAERTPVRTPIVPSPPPVPAPVPLSSEGDIIVPVTGVRKIIFERMGASSGQVARVTLTTEGDATRLVELRTELNTQQKEIKFSFTDLLSLLVARALLKYPYMNATLHEDGVHQHTFVNLGVAADTERGLLVPVLRDAHRKGLGEIYAELRRLSDAARGGKISAEDLRGGTFTITNLGQYEIDAFTPIVNQPETAILGIGRIVRKPAAYQGQIALRWMLTLSLSFDHRIVDGAPAARFLQQVKAFVETPGLMLI